MLEEKYYVWISDFYDPADTLVDWSEWLDCFDNIEEAVVFQQEMEYIEGVPSMVRKEKLRQTIVIDAEELNCPSGGMADTLS